MSEPLKPCPFCGKAVFQREDGQWNDSFTYCQDAECPGSKVWDAYYDRPIPASMWNRRRAPSPPERFHPIEREGLEALLERAEAWDSYEHDQRLIVAWADFKAFFHDTAATLRAMLQGGTET